MDEEALIALVRKAIGLYKTTGCLEYVDLSLQLRIRRELGNIGTPIFVKEVLVKHSADEGKIEFRRETREERQDRREFWFRALVPVANYPRPLFYELELLDDDPEVPAVVILNVHP